MSTATPAASVTVTATDAPPGERVTPAAAGTEKKGAPGFTVVFVIAGMLAVAYVMLRRRW